MVEKLDLHKFLLDLQGKAERLRERILLRKEEEGKKRMGQEAMKQKEQDLKEREREEKRAMIGRRLEEKKRQDIQVRRMKEINALEEDRKKLNQQDPKQVQLMIPTESRIGTYTKRENNQVAKKQSVPNLLSGANSTFKA